MVEGKEPFGEHPLQGRQLVDGLGLRQGEDADAGAKRKIIEEVVCKVRQRSLSDP